MAGIALAVTGWLVGGANAQTFTSPIPYTNSTSSPYFATQTVGRQYFLEDFEDGLVNTPGLGVLNGVLLGPSGTTDSVDIDDYTLNGSGTGGVSLRPATVLLVCQFNNTTLGGYPTRVGFVWTDGPQNSAITVTAVNPQGLTVSQTYAGLGDNSFSGTTADDRFIGVEWPAGIQELRIQSATSGMEIDHVQYNAPTLFPQYIRDRSNAGSTGDVLWHNPTTGAVSVWYMNNLTKTGGPASTVAPLTWSPQGMGDLDGDGDTDLLWRNSATNNFHVWLMNGQQVMTNSQVQNSSSVASNFVCLGIADFDGDRKADVLFRDNNNGQIIVWKMNGNTRVSGQVLNPSFWNSTGLEFMGTGDFNGDGRQDLLWRNASGIVSGWLMNGFTPIEGAVVGNASAITSEWKIGAIGDLNGDGRADIFWRNTNTAAVNGWIMNNLYRMSGGGIGSIPLAWTMRCSADINGDGKGDIIWTNGTTGQVNGWIMDGLVKTQGGTIATITLANWNLLNPD
jgi:hypothetical protein